jgi:hypothetical protein
MHFRWFIVFATALAALLSGCAWGDFTPYSGQQQNWHSARIVCCDPVCDPGLHSQLPESSLQCHRLFGRDNGADPSSGAIALYFQGGLDDFQKCFIDSTAVEANTERPTDSTILVRLIARVCTTGGNLHRPPVDSRL